MDLGETGGTAIVVVLVVFLLVANIFFKMRRGQKTPLGMAAALLAALNQNQMLVENFSFHWRSTKFKTGGWEKNEAKLHFMPQELLTALSNTFSIIEGFNEKIDAARKYRSDSYMASIDVGKLKAPLAKCRQELEKWLQANQQNPEMYPKRRRGLFG